MDFIGVVRGKRIELVDILPYPEGQVVKISVEPLEEQLRPGSPLAIRQMMHQSPHLTEEDMAELEQVMTG